MNNNISRACDIIEKIINKKLKEDTWKKLVAMDFIDILKDYKNKNDKNKKEREEKIIKIINNLKKLMEGI